MKRRTELSSKKKGLLVDTGFIGKIREKFPSLKFRIVRHQTREDKSFIFLGYGSAKIVGKFIENLKANKQKRTR